MSGIVTSEAGKRVAALHERLQDEAALVPKNGELAIVLRGDLAAMLSFAADKKMPGIDLKAGHSCDSGSPGSLVAGSRFDPLFTADLWTTPVVSLPLAA